MTRLAMLTVPTLCDVNGYDFASERCNFAMLCQMLSSDTSDEWNFVLLNRTITEQLHPGSVDLVPQSHDPAAVATLLQMCNPEVTPSLVDAFRDVTTDQVCHKFCLRSGLDTLIYYRDFK